MLIDRIQLNNNRHDKMRKSSFTSDPQNNYRYLERPLKHNQLSDLSFKGLSFSGKEEENKPKKPINPTLALLGTIAVVAVGLRFAPQYKLASTFSEKSFNEFTQKYVGSDIGKDLLKNLKESKLAQKMIKVDGDNISIYKKTIPQLIWDGLKYPFTILPGDILNGSVELLGKIKPFKNVANEILQKPLFKNIRQRSKIDAKVNALHGLVETQEKLTKQMQKGDLTESQVISDMFQKSVKMFDTQKYGAYDTKHERALNRLVSGLPPAIFLANDAYNLSRMMDDDSKKADKEKKTRFKQETARILSSGYLTLVTLGALNKYINNSKLGIMLMTGATVLVTEAFSRLSNGKHIKRLTPEEARRENELNNAPEKDIKPVTFKANETTQSNFEKKDEKAKEQQKPLLSMGTLLKASGVVIAAGFGIKGLRKIKVVDEAFKAVQKPFNNLYKKLTVIPDYTISQEKFSKIVNVLEENGFKDLATKYSKIAENLVDKDGIIHLGAKDKKFVKPAVNFVIAPFKFAYNAVTLPFRYTEKFVGLFKKKPPVAPKTAGELAKELSQKDVEVLAKTIESIGEKALKKDMKPQEFQSYVKDNILKAFNVTTMSNVSNAELSNLAKTAATASTLWFLMTDNYNMVMLKSNGNDKEGAETKFKERFVQELSRLFYQTLLIDLFNSTFRSQYNASLMGMSWITLTNTTLGEILTRKSVGMPVGAHSRDELKAIEQKQNEATGFVKGYYNFMRRLTGKRSIESYRVKETAKEQVAETAKEAVTKTPKPLVISKDRPVFSSIIKG